MPLPENFSPTEHLQDIMSNVQNKIVRLEFNDVGDDNWERDITTPRGSLRVACTHVESDSIAMTQLRLDLFYLVLRKAKDFHPAIFGIPSIDFQEKMRYFPQVQLYFEEKSSEAEIGYDILRTQVSIRLVGETSDKSKFMRFFAPTPRGCGSKRYTLTGIDGTLGRRKQHDIK